MSVTIELNGMGESRKALQDMPLEVREAVSAAVIGTGLDIEGDVKKRIQRGPKSGRVYQKYNPSRTHRASAPGQAPASDTGRGANSIRFDRVNDLTATVGSRLAYLAWLEYGTRTIAPRPAFVPAAEKYRPIFRARLIKALRKVVK